MKKNDSGVDNIGMSIVRADIIAADKVLIELKSNNLKQLKSIAAYHIAQASEKLIKIQIYQSGVPISNKSMYTHNLLSLANYAASLGADIYIPRYFKSKLQELTDWEVKGRYDIHYVVRIDVLTRSLKEVQDWYNIMWKDGYR
ncbi:MAG: HEPN domain-containing protein [Lachnospiraceae bacterium]|nr:HEPN domain-containing protein [Lachnospiraceae bacterium]